MTATKPVGVSGLPLYVFVALPPEMPHPPGRQRDQRSAIVAAVSRTGHLDQQAWVGLRVALVALALAGLAAADDPPVFSPFNFAISYFPENAIAGTRAGTVNPAVDPDGNTVTYSITGGNAGGWVS